MKTGKLFWGTLLLIFFLTSPVYSINCDDWPIGYRAGSGDYDGVKQCLEAGYKADSNALQEAALHGYVEITRLLLDYGAEMKTLSERESLLMRVAEKGLSDVAELLIQSGAQVNYQDKYGYTALILASRHGHADVASRLLASGSDPDLLYYYHRNMSGTALTEAAKNGHEYLVDLLIQNGANPNAVGRSCLTPMTWAVLKGHSSIVKKLLEAGAASNILGETSSHWRVTALSAARKNPNLHNMIAIHGKRMEETTGHHCQLTNEKVVDLKVVDEEFERRHMQELMPLVDACDHIRKRTDQMVSKLLELEMLIQETKKKILSNLDRTDAIDHRLHTIKGEMEEAIHQQMQEALRHVWETKEELERSIQDLEDYIIGKRTREDGTSIPRPLGKQHDWFTQVDNMKMQLTVMNERIISELESSKQIKALKQETQKLLKERSLLAKQTDELDADKKAIEDDYFSTQLSLELEEYRLRDKERKLEDERHRKPYIKSLGLKVDGIFKFQVSRELNQEIMAEYNDELSILQQEIDKLQKEFHKKHQAFIDAKKHRASLNKEMEESFQIVYGHGAHVASTIWQNAMARFGITVASDVYDVTMGLKDGGLAGVAAEFASKVIERTVMGNEAFDTFDESELRAQVFEISETASSKDDVMNISSDFPLGDALWGSVNEELRTIKYSSVKNGALQALQATDRWDVKGRLVRPRGDVVDMIKNLQKAQSALESATRELGPNPTRAGRESLMKHARSTLESWAMLKGDVERRYRNALRIFQETGERPDNLNRLRREFAQVRNVTRSSISQYAEAMKSHRLAVKNVEKANQQLAKVQNKLGDIKKMNIRELAKGIRQDIVVTAISEGLNTYLDSDEKEAWLEYFKQQIICKAVVKSFRHASNFYWNCYDDLQNVRSTLDDLKEMYAFIADEKKAYVSGIDEKTQLPFGLIKRLKEGFTTKPDSVIRLTIVKSGAMGIEPVLHDSVVTDPLSINIENDQNALEFNVDAIDVIRSLEGIQDIAIVLRLY